MANYKKMDDAAAARAFMLRRLYPDSEKFEFINGIVRDRNTDEFQNTTPISQGQRGRTGGQLKAPEGTYFQGLFHNHPDVRAGQMVGSRGLDYVGGGDKFSPGDIETADRTGLTSYITTPDGELKKYNPDTEKRSPVLGKIPWQEYEKYLKSNILRNRNKY